MGWMGISLWHTLFPTRQKNDGNIFQAKMEILNKYNEVKLKPFAIIVDKGQITVWVGKWRVCKTLF